MADLRCRNRTCGARSTIPKLLGRLLLASSAASVVEIKCPRCHAVNVFTLSSTGARAEEPSWA